MGPLRFSKSPVVGTGPVVMIVGAALIVWGVSANDFPWGLVLVGIGAAVSWAGWAVRQLKTDVFQDGLIHKTIKGEVRLLFRELKTFSYVTTVYREGIHQDVHVMSFVDEGGQTVGLQVEPNWRWNQELPVLRDELADLLADKLEAQLDSGVAWIPGVELRREGLCFPDTGQPMMPFSTDLPLSFQQGRCYLTTSVKTYEGDTGLPNFYPGLRLIERGSARAAARAKPAS